MPRVEVVDGQLGKKSEQCGMYSNEAVKFYSLSFLSFAGSLVTTIDQAGLYKEAWISNATSLEVL